VCLWAPSASVLQRHRMLRRDFFGRARVAAVRSTFRHQTSRVFAKREQESLALSRYGGGTGGC
jgi:hypothetical protein